MARIIPTFTSLLALVAAGVNAQSRLPVSTAEIPDQMVELNAAATEVDLSAYFAIDGVSGEIARFDTILGTLDVELLAEAAPNHVKVFKGYAEREDWDDTIIHRSASFDATDLDNVAIVQGGGYYASLELESVESVGNIALEYELPNARGTLGAARQTNPNTASNQWFFNVTDNSESLGPDNDGYGFTVFGEVIGNGMDVIDAIAALERYPFTSPWNEIPLIDYDDTVDLALENFVLVNSIRVLPIYPTAEEPVGALSFAISNNNPDAVAAAIEGSSLQLSAVDVGTARIVVTATDVRGDAVTQELVVEVTGIEITGQPTSAYVAAGSDATLSVAATSDLGTISYQWYRQRSGESTATALAGATGASLTLSNVSAGDMGFYWAEISSAGYSTTSEVAIVTLTGGSSYLANLSTRGSVPAGGELTPGFVLRGSGAKNLVIRAVGPTLASYGVTTAMADPTMAVVPLNATAPVASNDNWGDAANAAELASVSATLGAFPLVEGSADAALLTAVSLPNSESNNAHTVQVRSADGSAGIALAEVYDPDDSTSPVQLVNISARGFSGNGDDVLAPGFVISGTGAKTMLIRVVGPTLADYGVTGTMSDPRLEIIPSGQNIAIAANDNWGGTAALKAAFATTGAFGLAADSSLDAAVLVRLPPGAYTVKPSGVDGETGVILVEAYEVE